MEQIKKPLSGIKVIEFCQVASGPFSGMLFRDFGAEVIKVESPQGDGMRTWPPFRNGYSENFASLNRGKKSIALDLKDPQDNALAKRLLLEADVVIENNRPGVMARLGLGWQWALTEKPSIVYCSISAYGQTGPRSQEGGFDLTIQAASGIMSVTGEPDGDPVKCGVPLSDFTAGLYAAFSIAAMLNEVRRSGRGGHIDVPMFSTSLAIAALQTSEYFGSGKNPRKLGSAHPRNAPYQAFRARNGWFALAAGNNKLWYAVCKILGLLDLYEDPRFTTSALRAQNQIELKDILEERFLKEDKELWLEKFIAVGVPCAPINEYSSAIEDVQSQHLELVQSQVLPNGEWTRTIANPLWINGAPIPVETRPPALDEHGEEIRKTYASS